MMTGRKMLGLAVSQRSITAVEVGLAGGRRKVAHAAAFLLPEEIEGAERTPSEAVGTAFRHWLRQNHFSASRCVIGLGGRWLVAREKTLPPTAPDMLAGVLAIATEREFASDPEDLVFDYTSPVADAQGQSVLLAAAPRRTVAWITAMATAAGLTVTAVTSSVLGLAAATGGPTAGRRLVLHLSSDGAELCVQAGGGLRLMRRLSAAGVSGAAGAAGSADLAGDLRRVLALLPGGTEPGLELLVWNASDLPASALGVLAERLPLAMRVCEMSADLGVESGPPAGSGEFAAAAALAAGGLTRQGLPVNFSHSRLTPRRKIALKGKFAWGGGVAAAVLLVAALLFLDWRDRQNEIADLQTQLKDLQAGAARAKEVVDKTVLARGWYDRRPRLLDGLADIFLQFPEEGRIWATNLAVDKDLQVLLSGKAVDETAFLEVLDRLKSSPKFSDVKYDYLRGDATSGSREVSFAIKLSLVKAEKP
jgi:hypothetical protein